MDFESVIVTAEPIEKPERVLVLAIEEDVAETVAAQLPQQAGQSPYTNKKTRLEQGFFLLRPGLL